METRNDVHSPKNLVTEDYVFQFAEVNHLDGAPGWVARRGDWGLAMAYWISETDKLDRSTHQCHHCGAYLNYFAVLKHIPTGDAVVVGETCLDNRFERATAEFHKLRKNAKLSRERAQAKAAQEEFLLQFPELSWLQKDEETPEILQGNGFIESLKDQFNKKGVLSDRQVEALYKTIKNAEKRAQAKAEEAEINWIDVPDFDARVELTGLVLHTKIQETMYGSSPKALLRIDTDEGSYKVWTTVPSATFNFINELSDLRGGKLTIKTRLTRSDQDSTFAFSSRPSFVEFTTTEEEESA